MAMTQSYLAQQQSGRGGPSGLADVLEVLLDKGLVIDAFVRVSLVGIELITIDARVVVASVDTYLRFAEAVNRLDLLQVNNSQTLGDLVGGGQKSSRDKARGAAEGVGDKARELTGSESSQSDEREQRDEEPARSSNGDSDDDKSLVDKVKDRAKVF